MKESFFMCINVSECNFSIKKISICSLILPKPFFYIVENDILGLVWFISRFWSLY